MPTRLHISSLQNPRIKDTLKLLSEAKQRRLSGLFVVEGAREIKRALVSGYEPIQCFMSTPLRGPEAENVQIELLKQIPSQLIDVTPEVFRKLVVREDKDGLLVIFKQKNHAVGSLTLPENPLILAIHGIEKPGNLGALLRSADGAGASCVMVVGDQIDLYNPHVVRGSLGTLFALQIGICSESEFRILCESKKIQILAAALRDGARPHYAVDLSKPSALLVGSEAQGLPPEWLEWAHHVIKIPMFGIADSLNVSAAGAVLLYEALRQRTHVS